LAGCALDPVPVEQSGKSAPTAPSWPTASLADLGYRVPAEWEPMESVWLAWTVTGPVYDEAFMKNSTRALVKALREDETILIDLVVSPTADKTYAQKRQEVEDFLADPVDGIGDDAREGNGFIRYHDIPTTTFWMRDMGPVFLKRETAAGADLAMADFGFSFWDYESNLSNSSLVDEAVDRRIAKEMGIPSYRCAIIGEGGNVQFNGNGTILANEHVARHRNPHMSMAQIEAEYLRCTGARKIIWTKRGVVEDFASYEGFAPGGFKYVYDEEGSIAGTEEVAQALGSGTSGHTDEFATFAPGNTILLAEVRPQDLDPATNPNPYSRQRAAINKQRLDENYEILKKATDQAGRHFDIVRLPIPETEIVTLYPGPTPGIYDLYVGYPFEDGNMVTPGDPVNVMAATGYFNVLVTNELVLVPSYYHDALPDYLKPITAANDAEVMQTYAALYPGRTVVQFPYQHVINYNWYGGGIHCSSWQQPSID
jgi:agmatine deiminase